MSAYNDKIPYVTNNRSASDKGDAGSRNNMAGFSGGQTLLYTNFVTYDNNEFTITFQAARPHEGGPVVDNYQIKISRHQRDFDGSYIDCHVGGPGCIFPFVHASDGQLKFYLLAYPGDNQNRRVRVLRTGVFYR
jgi:hypothetical protein